MSRLIAVYATVFAVTFMLTWVYVDTIGPFTPALFLIWVAVLAIHGSIAVLRMHTT
jgi:hypothetical protein